MGPEDLRARLVDDLERRGYISSPSVKRAFLSVWRERFVPGEMKPYSYEDRPLPIGSHQTISAPSMIAIMLEASDLHEGLRVLEIGTGSGYNACLLAHIVGNGNVTSIERIAELCETARNNLSSCGRQVSVLCKDGTLGHKEGAPYDRIIVTAASPGFPAPLVEQLSTKGKIIAPIGTSPGMQELRVGTLQGDGGLSVTSHGHCVFVPLIGKYGF